MFIQFNDSINPHMVILFLHTYLLIRGVKVLPRVISGSITDRNKIPKVTSIFGVEQLNGTIVHYTRHKGSPKIQDGGLETGNTYISACRQDRNAILRATLHLRSSQKNCSTLKMRGSPWNGVSIPSRSWDISTSGLQAAILNFWTPLMSSKRDDSTIELLYPENGGDSPWHGFSILSTSWDISTSGL